MTWRCFVTNWEKTCSNARDIFLSYWKTILAEQMYTEFEVCCKVSTKFNEKPGSKSIDYKATTWNEWSRSVDDCKDTRDGNGTVDWNGWNMVACAKSKWWGIYWIKVCLCGVHSNSLREYHEAPGFHKKKQNLCGSFSPCKSYGFIWQTALVYFKPVANPRQQNGNHFHMQGRNENWGAGFISSYVSIVAVGFITEAENSLR